MKYRRAKPTDIAKIAKLLVKCFNITSIKEGKETFLKEKKSDYFIIAEEDGKIYGLISWDMHGLPKHQLVRVERICVLAGYDRDKIAEEMLTAAIQDADKYFKKKKLKLRKMYAMVHSHNKKLKNFYKKMGFMQEARIKDHYYKGTDEYILSIFFE
ncbi:GNAT family N-acetyltransferase [Candidatus Woesearchaeota archaeon]|nr:GNAT family N-acetyltransferase [Candidatus Woesearchaeota archaeon]